MPKRKKSHEYCRNRFGIFSKRRRVSCATEHRCEECVTRALAARQRRKSLDKSGAGEAGTHAAVVHESPSRGAISLTRVHQNTACDDCHQFASDASDPSPWLNKGNIGLPVSVSHSSGPQTGAVPTATLEDISSAESNICADVTMSSSCSSSSLVVDHCTKPSMEVGETRRVGETDERGRTISTLVSLTSSLKLTEGGRPACVSDAVLSQKIPMEISSEQELTPEVQVTAQGSTDPTSASTLVNISFGSHKPVHTHCGVYEPRRYGGSHRLPSRHRQPSLPRVNVVHEPSGDPDDSDEGFCEPVAKRSHRLSSGGDNMADPDEGVNVVEEILPSPKQHRRMEYTNHSLDASLGCTCSLFWQMMSNQYGVPTKIYSMERSLVVRHFDGHSHTVPHANSKLNWGAPMFEWTQKPGPTSNVSFDQLDSSIDEKSSNLYHEQQSGSGIFAIGNLVQDHSNVHGAVGLCVQRAVFCNKSVFVFDLQATSHDDDEAGNWYQYCRAKSRFVPCQTVPVLTQNYAGLGTSELTEVERRAIKAVFRETFGAP